MPHWGELQELGGPVKRTETTQGARNGVSLPVPDDHANHWEWRPEWGKHRPCWFWYLTFDQQTVEHVVPARDLDRLRSTPWLDAVPAPWLHLTISEVGFADGLDDPVVTQIHDIVKDLTGDECQLPLRLGPVHAMRTAIVLQAEGGDRLRRLQQRVREATARVLDADGSLLHPHEFRPHVTLGYLNQPVAKDEVADLVAGMDGVAASVRTADLALVAVTRQGGHYRWTARADVGDRALPS